MQISGFSRYAASIRIANCTYFTEWKLQYFSVTQILRENKISDLVLKSAIITHLHALNFDFHEFLHFLNSEICQINKIRVLKMARTAVLKLLYFAKMISRKILKALEWQILSLSICQLWFHVKSDWVWQNILKFPHYVLSLKPEMILNC